VDSKLDLSNNAQLTELGLTLLRISSGSLATLFLAGTQASCRLPVRLERRLIGITAPYQREVPDRVINLLAFCMMVTVMP
jgi:hypothetical protein